MWSECVVSLSREAANREDGREHDCLLYFLSDAGIVPRVSPKHEQLRSLPAGLQPPPVLSPCLIPEAHGTAECWGDFAFAVPRYVALEKFLLR